MSELNKRNSDEKKIGCEVLEDDYNVNDIDKERGLSSDHSIEQQTREGAHWHPHEGLSLTSGEAANTNEVGCQLASLGAESSGTSSEPGLPTLSCNEQGSSRAAERKSTRDASRWNVINNEATGDNENDGNKDKHAFNCCSSSPMKSLSSFESALEQGQQSDKLALERDLDLAASGELASEKSSQQSWLAGPRMHLAERCKPTVDTASELATAARACTTGDRGDCHSARLDRIDKSNASESSVGGTSANNDLYNNESSSSSSSNRTSSEKNHSGELRRSASHERRENISAHIFNREQENFTGWQENVVEQIDEFSSQSADFERDKCGKPQACSEPPGVASRLLKYFGRQLSSRRSPSASSTSAPISDRWPGAQARTGGQESSKEEIRQREATGASAQLGCFLTRRRAVGGTSEKRQQQTADDDQDSDTMPGRASHYGTTSARGHLLMSSAEQERIRIHSVSRRSRADAGNGYSRLGQSHYYKSAARASIWQELKRIVLLLIIVAICGLVLWQIYEILIEEEMNHLGVNSASKSELGRYKHYAVSTDAKPCAKVGEQLLARGGHAVDAAIGTLICMGVVLPNSLGLGGGCLMTIYNNVTKQALAIDGRELAPDYAHEHMYDASNPIEASRGPLSVGVPGELAAYWEAHQRFGRLKWSELFGEGIRMALEGEPVVNHLASALQGLRQPGVLSSELRSLMWNATRQDYVHENDLFKQPKLGETLRRISEIGVQDFYGGLTGQLFIEDLRKLGGKMTLQNLANYKARVSEALLVELAPDLRLYTQPIPGSGVLLGVILRIMRRLGYLHNEAPKQSFDAAALYYHHLVEAYKFAYAQRAGLEDEPDDKARMTRLMSWLQSDQFIEQAASLIETSGTNRTMALSNYGGLQYFQDDHGTAHVSVIDSQGNSVAVTSTVNQYFGSGLVSPSTGIIYNDIMDDFASPNITNHFKLPPSKFNRIKPGRRPLSSMAPSVFVNARGSPELVIGASGGTQITSSIASVALRNLFLNDDIKTAIDSPRLHHQFLPDKLMHEADFARPLLDSLARRGHKVEQIKGRSAIVMALACRYNKKSGALKLITANSDHRKGGSVAGL